MGRAHRPSVQHGHSGFGEPDPHVRKVVACVRTGVLQGGLEDVRWEASRVARHAGSWQLRSESFCDQVQLVFWRIRLRRGKICTA
eukprot:3275757-Rhodomonas_salina.1